MVSIFEMDGISYSSAIMSDHIGNLILQELFMLKKDVKNEIQALGKNLANLITANVNENLKNVDFCNFNLDVSENFESNVTDLPFFCDKDTDDIQIVGSYQLNYQGENDNSEVYNMNEAVPETFNTHSNEYATVPIFECDGLTETNLMTMPCDVVTSSAAVELLPCSVPVSDTFSKCNSDKNDQDSTSVLNDADVACLEDVNVKSTRSIPISTKIAQTSNNEIEMSSVPNDDSIGLLTLAKNLPVPSVSVIKYEDTDDLSIINSNGFAGGDTVSTDEEGTPEKSKRKNCKLQKVANHDSSTNVKRRGRSPKINKVHPSKSSKLQKKKSLAKFIGILSQQRDTQKKRMVCNICGKRFVHQKILLLHMKKSHNDHQFLCPICKKPFVSHTTLKTHLQVHKGVGEENGLSSDDELLECSICNKVLFTNETFNMHMRAHFKQTSFNCKFCSKMFFGLKKLHKHMNEHQQKTGLVCRKCGKGFKSDKVYKQHMKKHIRAPYSCSVCKKVFVLKSGLNDHMLTAHGHKVVKKVPSLNTAGSHSPYALRKRSKN